MIPFVLSVQNRQHIETESKSVIIRGWREVMCGTSLRSNENIPRLDNGGGCIQHCEYTKTY